MKYNKKELQLIHDGLEDTLIRLKEEQIKEDYESYTFKIIVLKRKVMRDLNNKNTSNKQNVNK